MGIWIISTIKISWNWTHSSSNTSSQLQIASKNLSRTSTVKKMALFLVIDSKQNLPNQAPNSRTSRIKTSQSDRTAILIKNKLLKLIHVIISQRNNKKDQRSCLNSRQCKTPHKINCNSVKRSLKRLNRTRSWSLNFKMKVDSPKCLKLRNKCSNPNLLRRSMRK